MKNFLNVIYIILGLALIVFITFYLSNKENKKIDDRIVANDQAANSSTQDKNDNLINQNQEINKNEENKNMENTKVEKNYKEAILHTNLGDITFSFSADKPNTTNNFIKLASEGFYSGIKFHRVIKGFMIQAGDPNSKDDTKKAIWGTGGPGYKFNDELTGQETYNIGTVAMANSGPNTNGSQFFIMTSNTGLPPNYTVFGKVISGQEIAQKIQDVATDASDKPIDPIIIKSVELK